MSGTDAFSFDELDQVLAYEPGTGKFWWKVAPAKNVYAGAEAGAVKRVRSTTTGQDVSYRYIRYRGISMPASRVAHLLVNHEWPFGKVSFANGDTLDTRFVNLSVSASTLPPQMNRAYMKEHRENFPHAWKEWDLQKKFQIGMAEFAKMVAAQNNRCAICGQEETATRDGKLKTLAVDHNHKTGKIRALLCHECNVGIGKLGDDAARLRAAADYLDKHSEKDDKMNVLPFNPGEAS